MKSINEKIRSSSSINQKIRKANFIPYEVRDSETFKYKVVHKLKQKLRETYVAFKRNVNTILQKPLRWAAEVDWKLVKADSVEWCITVVVEGFTANVATHFLFGVPFNFGTIVAHGIAINQGISIYWRLRKDGSTNKIPTKNQ